MSGKLCVLEPSDMPSISGTGLRVRYCSIVSARTWFGLEHDFKPEESP